jgi:hypothetical protein
MIKSGARPGHQSRRSRDITVVWYEGSGWAGPGGREFLLTPTRDRKGKLREGEGGRCRGGAGVGDGRSGPHDLYMPAGDWRGLSRGGFCAVLVGSRGAHGSRGSRVLHALWVKSTLSTSDLATVTIRVKDSAIRLDAPRSLAACRRPDVKRQAVPRDESGGRRQLRRDAVSIG